MGARLSGLAVVLCTSASPADRRDPALPVRPRRRHYRGSTSPLLTSHASGVVCAHGGLTARLTDGDPDLEEAGRASVEVKRRFLVGQVQYPGQSKCSKVASSPSLSLSTRGLKCMLRRGVHLLEQLDTTLAVTKNECRSQGCLAHGDTDMHAFIIIAQTLDLCSLCMKSPTPL